MRTILLTLMLLLTLTACGGKEDVPIVDPNGEAVATEGAETTPDEAAPAEDDKPVVGIAKDEASAGPVAAVQLKDNTIIEIAEFNKLGNYYLYISGKLNGRSSTVISFTRLKDVQRWAMFEFKDPNNFIIKTKAGKELRFLDSRIYIGSKSHEAYSFYIMNDNYEKELIEIKKADVAFIRIN